MRRLLVIGFLIVIVLQPVNATNKPSQPEPIPSTWAMEMPKYWAQMKCDIPQCLVVAYDSRQKDQRVIMTIVFNVAVNMTLDQVFKTGEKSAPYVMQDYKLLEHGYTKVGGLPAYYVICTFKSDDGKTLKSKCFVVIRKGIAYTFTFGCLKEYFKEHSEEYESIITSVKWLESPEKKPLITNRSCASSR